MKILPGCVAAAVLASAAGDAQAVDLQGGYIEIVLQKYDADNDRFIDMSTTEIDEFFNISNCLCPVELAIEVTLRQAAGQLASEPVEVWVGTNCDDTSDVAQRDAQCVLVTTVEDVNLLKTPTTIPIVAGDLMWPNSPSCEDQEVTRNIYLLIDDDGDLEYENVISLEDGLFVDTAPPPNPEPAELFRAEQGALVEWTVPEANTDDIRSYQMLCARADGTFNADDGLPRADAAYLTPLMVCPDNITFRADVPGGMPTGGRAIGHGIGHGIGSPAEPYGVLDAGPVDGGVVDGGIVDAGPQPDAGPPPTGIDLLDPMFVCSGEIGATESSYRIDGLTDGVEYRVFLVTIDPRRNFSVLDLGTVIPQSVTDFWEDYKGSGGGADGGYCFVATATYGDYGHPFVRVLRDFRDESLASTHFGRRLIRFYYDHSPGLAGVLADSPILRAVSWLILLPIVIFAGLWVYTGILAKLALLAAFGLFVYYRRSRKRARAAARVDGEEVVATPRRRHGRAIAAASVTVVVLAWSQLASAQPYWDEPGGPADQQAERRVTEHRSQWSFDLKFGPYKPDIDSEFDLGPDEQGPYEQMFGGRKLMTQFELDRILLYPKGQLGVGVGIGFMQASANAFEIDAMGDIAIDPETGKPIRSAGDKTKLRVMPLYLNAVYRFTMLDDELRIPLIPYGKLGLGWYVWNIERPDGKTASVNEDPMCAGDDCAQNKAAGASLGWQATIGLAIRAERIDPSAARSLNSELGIEHASFFAELLYARVDGFGADDRLRVGDTTWLAGINFEF
jgi:hypothetical protein